MTQFDWYVLGISPTKDEDAIRRAYGEALKKHHPEDDPERWAILHTAYQKALEQARGGSSLEAYIPLQPQPEREQGADALFAEAFDAALQESETEERGELPKRFPRVRRERDVGVFLEAIRTLPLRTGGSEILQTVRQALQRLRPKRMTREAREALINGLWSCAEELPQAAMRTCIEKFAVSFGERLQTPEEIWRDDRKDAGIVRIVSIIALVSMLLNPTSEGMLFASGCAGVAALLTAFARRRQPRPRRERRVNRTVYEKKSTCLLVTAIAVFLITQLALIPAAEALAPETVETQITAADYVPGQRGNRNVKLTVTEPPEYLCTTAPLTDATPNPLDTPGVVRTHYYLCRAERAVLAVPDAKRAEAEALFAQCPFTIWGQAGALEPDDGWCIRTPDGRAPDVSVEEQLQNYSELIHTVQDCGGDAVVTYRSREPFAPEKHEVVSTKAQVVFGLLTVLNADAWAVFLLRLLRIWF